jgi:vitamin B12 transporter
MKIVFMLIFYTLVFGQTQVEGFVYDENNQPIEFVNIYIEKTINGTITDEKGYFHISDIKKEKPVLVAQFTGYKTERLSINNDSKKLEIVLKEDISRSDIVEVQASAFITDEKKKGVIARPMDVITTPGAAADINRFYQTMPGVSTVDDGAGLFVRGGHVSETIMQIDGARIIHPYRYESPSGGFFGTITPFLTKGSAFYTGALSSKYGNVLSGMVDMESNDLSDENQYVLVFGLAAISSRIDHVFAKDKASVSFSGNYSETERFMKFNNSRRNFSSFPESYDLNMNFNYKIKNDLNLKLFLFRESNSVGLDLDVPSGVDYFSDSKNNLANLQLRGLLSSDIIFSSNLAYTEYEMNDNLGNASSVVKDKLLQAKFAVEILVGDISTIFAGTDLQEIKYDYSGNEHTQIDSIYKGVKGQNYTESIDILYNGSYLDLKTPLSKELVLNTGFRFEYQDGDKKLYADPRISISYQANEQLNLSGSYGIYHQIPELEYYVNNSNLLSQKSESFVFGLTYDLQNVFLLKSEIYYKNYRNLVRNISSSSDRTFNNNGEGSSRGIDLLLKRKNPKFEYWASYSWLTAERLEGDYVKLTSPEFDITNNFTFVFKYNLSSSFNAGLKYLYHTGKPYRYSSNPELINTKRLEDYSRFDLNFNYILSLYPKNMTVLFLSVNNILGKENILNRRYDASYSNFIDQKSNFLRSVYFGFSFKF